MHKKGWDIQFGAVILNNVHFVYRKEKYVTAISNNINFDDISLAHTFGTISGLKFEGDTVFARISHLKTREQSGFELNDLSVTGSISEKRLLCKNIYIKTPGSLIRGKLDFSYNNWDDYTDFIEKVNMDAALEDSTRVDFNDIAAFASELNGLSKTVFISGAVKAG